VTGGRAAAIRSKRHAMSRILAHILIGLVWVYRGTLGLLLGGHCRYWPSCSQYMIEAIRQYGPVRGTWRGVKRLGRCHPFGGSGYDPV